MPISFWSKPAADRADKALQENQPARADGTFPFSKDGRFYRAVLSVAADGMVILEMSCPRPLRLWIDGVMVLDEALWWRSFQRQIQVILVNPFKAGEKELLFEVGTKPRHSEKIDEDCPSRNRFSVLAALDVRFPDSLRLTAMEFPGTGAPAVSLRFNPTQFHRGGLTWQEVMVRLLKSFGLPPSVNAASPIDQMLADIDLEPSDFPMVCHDATTDSERISGLKHVFVPVCKTGALVALRKGGIETRPEPEVENVKWIKLLLKGGEGSLPIRMPVYESLGRLAPQREWRKTDWPDRDDLIKNVPRPILPADKKSFAALYDASWALLLRLVRKPALESGYPGDYIGTSEQGFLDEQFVWDTSFTVMAAAYGWRALPIYASLDALYSRQFDGGYIHRETDTRSGLPISYEPDFSPNPPLMAVAELAIARLSGNVDRLKMVYPALCALHEWLEVNRKLPDGTYWTTGLANGLDNSPSLGDGYPCLTAQMAHHAECLAEMAKLMEFEEEAVSWMKRRDQIAEVLNDRLWSEKMQFYSTSVHDGGHNPNKVVTGFWPLWAGVVPPERVAHLARHLKDPASFWRYHPVPSLAADSPQFVPEGQYWLGSTWAPTNAATIKGFWRSGRKDLARETAARHLTVMHEVFAGTNTLWENYCSEGPTRGSWSGPGYSWTIFGPIALLLEVVIGIEPDAPARRLRWTPPPGERIGVDRYPLGKSTVSLLQEPSSRRDHIVIRSDWPITVELVREGRVQTVACKPGRTETDMS